MIKIKIMSIYVIENNLLPKKKSSDHIMKDEDDDLTQRLDFTLHGDKEIFHINFNDITLENNLSIIFVLSVDETL